MEEKPPLRYLLLMWEIKAPIWILQQAKGGHGAASKRCHHAQSKKNMMVTQWWEHSPNHSVIGSPWLGVIVCGTLFSVPGSTIATHGSYMPAQHP